MRLAAALLRRGLPLPAALRLDSTVTPNKNIQRAGRLLYGGQDRQDPLSRDKRVFRRKGPWQDAGAACSAPRHDRAGRSRDRAALSRIVTVLLQHQPYIQKGLFYN